MAIKIGGTTVIDDSANITTSVGGFKTVNGTGITGSGDIDTGSSPTVATSTYTQDSSNVSIHQKWSISNLDYAVVQSKNSGSWTNTSNNQIVLNTTMPTWDDTKAARIKLNFQGYADSITNGVSSQAGIHIRFWAEIANSKIFPILKNGVMTSSTSAVESYFETPNQLLIYAHPNAPEPTGSTHTTTNQDVGYPNIPQLNLKSGGKLYAEIFNYYTDYWGSRAGSSRFNSFSLSMEVMSDLDVNTSNYNLLYA